jgi:PAS domain S-box-containing protein
MSIEELAAAGKSWDLVPFGRTGTALDVPSEFVEKLPLAIYACDAHGRLLWFNQRAVKLWGRAPRLNDETEKYSGFRKAYVDGRQLCGEELPTAWVLRTGIPVRGIEGEFERNDGSHVWAMVHIEPVKDEDGYIVGAVNCFHETTEARATADALTRRTTQQTALYQFTEGLQRAATFDDVFDLGLTAIQRALACQRAAVLLFDDAGVMRFVASRGLSETYRRAVEGHTPWTRDTRRPRPISYNDIDCADLPDSLKQIVSDEGIRALAFIPLVEHGKLLGKFMAYYDEPHVFAEAEVELALTIARQLGFGVERIRSEEARTTAELAAQWLASVVESSDDAIVSKTLDGIIMTWNKAAERIFGYTAEEVIGQPITILFPPDRLHEEPDILARVRRGERIDHYETIRRRKDGTMLDISLTVSPVKDHTGRIVGAAKIARDVTERKRADEAAQRLAAIVESSDDAIISKDTQGVIKTWNKGAERIFGYAAEEVIGKPVTILMPPERVDEEPTILARIRRGERMEHYETVRRRKDGTLLDISLTVSPIRDATGRVVGASKIARDITDRKRAEAKLRDSEKRLHDLITAIPAAIYTTDAEGRITYFNEAAVALAGRTPEIGSDEWCVTWKLYKPDGTPLPHDECPMAVALKEGRQIRNAEAVAERPDGTRVPFIPYPTPLRDADGNIVGAINMLVDISERRQAETQQQILLKELNHRVKNNMQTLQSLLHMATMQTENPEARKVLSEATSRVTAMAAAQRVFYSTANATEFDVDELVQSVCEAVQQTLPPRVTIHCNSDPGRLSNEDAMPLALILNELLTNAAKYGFNGRGEGTIRVSMKNGDGAFTLSVEDDGPGFDLQAIRKKSSGLRLIDGLARQLRGKFNVTRTSPTRCTLRFS